MRQAEDSQIQNISSNAPSVLEISDNARVKELKSSDQQAVLNGVRKKAILKEVLKQKKAILKLAADADEEYALRGDEKIEPQINEMFKVRNVLHSGTSINQADKHLLSETVVSLFDKFEFLLGYHKRLEEAEGGVTTRAASADPSHIKLMKEFITKREEVDARIVSKAAAENTSNDSVLTSLPLTAEQKSRKFDPTRIPKDDKLWKCPFCDHYSINEDPDNQKYEDNNKRKDDVYNQRLAVWKDWKDRHDKWTNNGETGPEPEPPKEPFDSNKQMSKRKPRAGKYDVAALQCMCSTASCKQLGSDIGSDCFLFCRVIDEEKCCDLGIHPFRAARTTQERHPTITQGLRERCGCGTCLCPCSMRIPVNNYQKIASAKAKVALQQRNGQQQRSSGIQETANFVRTLAGAGAVAAGAVLQSNRNLVEGSNNQGPVSDQVVMDHYHQGAAMAAARIGSSAFTQQGIQTMRDGLRRGTNVELPSGDSFDTRLIGTKKNAHQQNNRLPGMPENELLDATSSGRATQPHPGMLDSLNPDYSDTTDSFNQASRLTNLASQLVSAPLTAAAAAHQSVANQRPSSYNPNVYVPNGMSEEDQMKAFMAGGMSKDTKQSMMNEKEDWMKNIDDGTKYIDDGTYLDEDGTIHIESPQRKMPASYKPQGNMPPLIPPSQRNIMSSHMSSQISSRRQWNPFSGPGKKKPPGGERIITRITQANAKRFNIKHKKPGEGSKKERKRAKLLQKKISAINAEGKTSETGNTVAMACGVKLSQISAYEDGKVADEDGEYFKSQDGLAHLENLLSMDSDSDEEEK